jgi:hypothetical protein
MIADEDHGTRYREMFAPSVTAAPLKPADISGYRNDLVYDRRFMYVPLNCGALPDSMPALFDCCARKRTRRCGRCSVI